MTFLEIIGLLCIALLSIWIILFLVTLFALLSLSKDRRMLMGDKEYQATYGLDETNTNSRVAASAHSHVDGLHEQPPATASSPPTAANDVGANRDERADLPMNANDARIAQG